MSCNLSLFSGVLVRGMAFPACTLLLDPVSLRRLRGRGGGGSGCEAIGGADTGLFGCCSMASLHHQDMLLCSDDGVTGDGMTKSVTLVADDAANGSLHFKHFWGC